MKILNNSKCKNIFIYFLSFFASAAGILLNFSLARLLKADLYGELQLYISTATLFSQFAIFGINNFLIKESKNPEKANLIFERCLTLYSLIFLILLPFFVLTLRFLILDKATSLIYYIFILLITLFIGINSLITSHWQGSGKYHFTLLFESLIPKGSLLLLSLLILFCFDVVNFVPIYLCLYIVIYLSIILPVIIKNFKKFNLSFSRKEIITLLFFFGVTITYNLGKELSKVIQGSFYNNNIALATISVSTSIINLISVFTNVLNNLAKPLFSKFSREHNNDELLEIYRFNTRVNSYVSIPFYIFFIIFPSKFLIIFGESFTQYPLILSIMAIAGAVSSLTGPNGTMLNMTGYEKYELYNGILYFIVYISFIFILNKNEVYGVTISYLIAELVVNIAKYVECIIIFKKNPLGFKTILTMLIIVIVNLFAVQFLYLIKNLILWFIIGILVGIILVILNAFVLSLYRRTDFKKLISLRV